LKVIEDVRENNPDLFEKIKQLPRKSRTARQNPIYKDSLITYFRSDRLQKFFIADKKEGADEIDFMETAGFFECTPDTDRHKVSSEMFDLLKLNKKAFEDTLVEDEPEVKGKGGRDAGTQILKILKVTQKNSQALTDDQEIYLDKVVTQINEGGIPKKTLKHTLKALNDLKEQLINPRKVIAVLQNNISDTLLKAHYAETDTHASGERKVVLSLYLTDD